MNIPIQNIYYLLCYAWNKLEESKIVSVKKIDGTSLIELLSKVLANGVSYLLRLGLDRNYKTYLLETGTIRGKINFNTTLKKNYFSQPVLYCEYDELSHNILHNQIIKTTINRLIHSPEIDPEI